MRVELDIIGFFNVVEASLTVPPGFHWGERWHEILIQIASQPNRSRDGFRGSGLGITRLYCGYLR
jgi:hypothetical protein